ncbi:hypothetical protein LCGC14_0511040 [marine sediment metagenome]|uniref:Uncharacterized protein n=1 Tax=marine sediment metagenome TaxID=412755 RepID=A0A0F9V9L1_9ZZZZ
MTKDQIVKTQTIQLIKNQQIIAQINLIQIILNTKAIQMRNNFYFAL